MKNKGFERVKESDLNSNYETTDIKAEISIMISIIAIILSLIVIFLK